MKLNLGCPRVCSGFTCIDLHPKENNVIEYDAIEYLMEARDIEWIRAYNLIEHLPNVGEFFYFSHSALADCGVLEIRTDNAEWFPFYVPLVKRLGWAAHACDDYHPAIMNDTRHYCVFSIQHLRHYAELYGFTILEKRRVTFGARLYIKMMKV